MRDPVESTDLEQLLLAVLDHESVGVAVFAATEDESDFRVVYRNPSYQALRPFREMSGRRYTEIWPDTADLVIPRFRQVLESGVPWMERDLPFDVEAESGAIEKRFYAFAVMRLNVVGVRYLLVGVTETTSEVEGRDALRESEQRYRLLFANMLDGFAYCRMLFDDEGRPMDFVYIDVNPSFERLTGLHSVIGRNVTDAIPGIRESNREVFEVYGRVVRTGRPERFETELPQLHRVLSIAVYRPHPGHFVAVFDDVTERKRAEAEREETLRVLTQKDRAIRQAYSDVIDAVTGGRLVILGRDELDSAMIAEKGRPYEIRSPSELAEARTRVRNAVAGVPDVDGLLVAFSEGVTNMLKHAGGGTYQVSTDERRVQLILRDHGPGIDFRNLPKATLVPGFSTQQTLGMGFTLMMELTDRLLLCSDPGGTLLVLEKDLARRQTEPHATSTEETG